MRASFVSAFKPAAIAVALGLAALLHPFAASALDFDFAFGGPASAPAGTSFSNGGVTATGYLYNGGSSFTAGQKLWQRNTTDDRGLGICSEGSDAFCLSRAGDVNEISNQANDEVLRLELPSGKLWAGLTVSSLDSGGTNNQETGIVYWSNSASPDLSSTPHFVFKWGDFGGSVHGDLFSLASFAAAGLDPGARFIFFRASNLNVGSNGKGNNDFLVWGGNLSVVPEPSSLAMIVAGIGMIGFVALRRRNQL